MTPDAQRFWNETIATANHLGAADSELCRVAIELLELLNAATAIAKQDPTDREARIAVTGYAERFGRTLAQLGVDPAGRQRLQPDRLRDEVDPLEEFGIVG